MVFPRPIPRCFELKTNKISRDGQVKSLKEGKFHKDKGSLEKLCNFGSPQTFLLEAFIVEAGQLDPATIIIQVCRQRSGSSTARKYEQITRADYGYVVLPIEQIPALQKGTPAWRDQWSP